MKKIIINIWKASSNIVTLVLKFFFIFLKIAKLLESKGNSDIRFFTIISELFEIFNFSQENTAGIHCLCNQISAFTNKKNIL